MITIGLVTFGEHPSLIDNDSRPVTLNEYAGHFPIVELDTPFYGIPREQTILNWKKQVPDTFQFILKANRLMTLHDRMTNDPASEDERLAAFKNYHKTVLPLVKSHQLKTILFQFPPSFKRSIPAFTYLRNVRRLMKNLPIAIEFRNPSWYDPTIIQDVQRYLSDLKMTWVMVDEPHNNNQGVPFDPIITNSDFMMLRLHGRNEQGWNSPTNWRKNRTLYNYSTQELIEIAEEVKKISAEVQEVAVIFNNNSGGDAAGNAKELQQILGIDFHGLAAMQLDLF